MAAALMAFAFILNTAKMVIDVNAPDFAGEAVKIDFTAFWAGARLAVEGRAIAAFDPNVLREAMAVQPSSEPGDLLWLYPPFWHMVVTPLGYLPFSAAYIVYSLVGLTLYCLVMMPLAKPLPGGIGLVLAGPAVLIILTLGNNSLYLTAGLAAVIATLGRGQAMLAGAILALMTVKPQLGLMIPFALAFGGYWRTILWAMIGTAIVLVLSTSVMGLDYWRAFLQSTAFMSEAMRGDLVRFDRMMTWYAFARLTGAGHDIAYPIQLLVMLACAAAVSWVWSRRGATLDLKAAALCTAAPMATPYAFHYEMTLALVAAMFLARDGFGASRGEKLLLLALWLGPVPGLALLGQVPPVLYAAPLMTVTLVICVWRARRAEDGVPAPTAALPN